MPESFFSIRRLLPQMVDPRDESGNPSSDERAGRHQCLHDLHPDRKIVHAQMMAPGTDTTTCLDSNGTEPPSGLQELRTLSCVSVSAHTWAMTKTYTWQGIDDPARYDLADITVEDHGHMSARGLSRSETYVTAWNLDVGPGWITRTLEVAVFGRDWSRSLNLQRNDNALWEAEARTTGDTDLPDPGLGDPESIRGALDCDLGLCPVTNTMPIRRLGLLDTPVEETPLVMAWVEVPSLRVIRSDQVYASRKAVPGSPSHRQVLYRSFSRDFHAELTVDSEGIVVEYPGLARRL
jgi:hypothetical protein